MSRGRFIYLSLGAGVQSTAMLAMSDRGDYGVPRADVAVFADTHAEPRYVYEHLEKLKGLVTIPIHVASKGSLEAEIMSGKRMELPAFTESDSGGGMVRRQCTRDYKVYPIQRWVRSYLGYTRGQRMKHDVICMVGISVDEIQRAKPSQDAWITRIHPLIDADLRRKECMAYLEKIGWPVPKKSSCVFCPYHDAAAWRDLKENYPQEWERAVKIDHAIRNSSAAGISKPVYLHRSMKPLDEVEFKPAHTTPLFDSFTEECEGMCGV